MSGSYSADQITKAISSALKARDTAAVPALLRLLATVDPHRAAAMYETILAGLEIAGNKSKP